LGGEVKEISEIREIREMSEKIMRKSKLFMVGIDFIKSNEGYQVLEINTSPQFKGFEQATGEDVAGNIVNRLVQVNN
jgi:ribosomal protein S6--L-glutamate ligase